MSASTFTGLFPVFSTTDTEGRIVLGLCGEDDNLRNVTLGINNLSGMQNKALKDHVCFISGTFLIYNEGPDAVDAPFFMIEASTVEDLGVLAQHMTPSSERLTNANFIGQVVAIPDAGRREFGLSTGAWSSRDMAQRSFEVRLHFDDNNQRFNDFRVPRIGANVEVSAKWIRDNGNRSHWVVEYITYLGGLPITAPTPVNPTTPPIRRQLFGVTKVASSSKRPASPALETQTKKTRHEDPADAGPSTQHRQSQLRDEMNEKEETNPEPSSTMSSNTMEEEDDTELAGNRKGKERAK